MDSSQFHSPCESFAGDNMTMMHDNNTINYNYNNNNKIKNNNNNNDDVKKKSST